MQQNGVLILSSIHNFLSFYYQWFFSLCSIWIFFNVAGELLLFLPFFEKKLEGVDLVAVKLCLKMIQSALSQDDSV